MTTVTGTSTETIAQRITPDPHEPYAACYTCGD